MPEWSIGAVSKTVDLFWGSKGSNPFLSARTKKEKPLGLLFFYFPWFGTGVHGEVLILT